MLPGLGSDWEIDPANIAILRRPDGTEWELGSGASGRVNPAVKRSDLLLCLRCSARLQPMCLPGVCDCRPSRASALVQACMIETHGAQTRTQNPSAAPANMLLVILSGAVPRRSQKSHTRHFKPRPGLLATRQGPLTRLPCAAWGRCTRRCERALNFFIG